MTSTKQHIPVSERQEARRSAPVVRLSQFQRMMLEWDKIHPYNAVHALSLEGRADVFGLQEAVRCACRAAGVSELVVDAARGTCIYQPFEDIQIRELSGGRSTEHALRAVIREEMNKPFPAGPHFPLRWIVFDDTANDAHYLVLAYHHVAADGYSIQALLALVLRHILGLSPPGGDSVLHPPRLNHGHLYGRGSHRLGHVRSLAGAVRQYFKLRRAHRMREDRSGLSETEFLSRSAPGGTLDRLREVCKAEGAGLNDVFLAALATALAQLTPARRTHRRRRKIAVATVLSNRRLASEDLSDVFGVYIRDAAVLIDKPDAGIRGVLSQVVPQSRRFKRLHVSVEPSWRFLFVQYLWPALRIPHSEASYRKVFPLCAGVSTVSVDATRFGEAMGCVRRYVRACPPGPAMPMLLAPTLASGRLEFGLVFRSAYLNEAQGQELLDLLVDALGELAG